MDSYTLMRQFADSWGLLGMFVFFVGVIVWVFRPGAKKIHEDVATTPFRNEDRPAEPRGE